MDSDGDPSPSGDDTWFDGETILTLIGVALVLTIVGSLLLIGVLVTGGGPDETTVPDTDWTLERVNDTHVRLVHMGGDPVDTRHLLVTADGRERHPSWTTSTLTEGESGTLRARPVRDVVRLYWVDEPKRQLLETWTLS